MAQKPLTVQGIDAELAQERRAAALHSPLIDEGMHRRLSDDEIIARGLDPGSNQFDVPEEIIPEGMRYQWHRVEVTGKPDTKRMADAIRNGWRDVPAERHDGRWMPRGCTGAIEIDGQRLMELPEPEAWNRDRAGFLRARAQKQAGAEMLGRAPAGTGPRTHPGVRPQVSSSIERLPVEQ